MQRSHSPLTLPLQGAYTKCAVWRVELWIKSFSLRIICFYLFLSIIYRIAITSLCVAHIVRRRRHRCASRENPLNAHRAFLLPFYATAKLSTTRGVCKRTNPSLRTHYVRRQTIPLCPFRYTPLKGVKAQMRDAKTGARLAPVFKYAFHFGCA